MNNELLERLNQQGCTIVGFADLQLLPDDMRKGIKKLTTGIVLGATYSAGDTSQLLKQFSDCAVNFLVEKGYKAKTENKHPKILGTLSGIGWIGRSAMLTTSQTGPALRLTCVFTDAPFEHGTPITQSQCPQNCTSCADACPANAIKGGLWERGVHRDDFFDVGLCMSSRGKCNAACIKACPFAKKGDAQ